MEEETFLDANLKAEIAIEALKGEKTIEEIANQYGISKSQVRKFKRQLQDKGYLLFSKESVHQQNETLHSILEETSKSNKAHKLTAWSNLGIVIVAAITIIVYLILGQTDYEVASNTKSLANQTEKLGGHTEKLASHTEKLAKHTENMAKYLQEEKDLMRIPNLDISFFVSSGFQTNTTDKWLTFEAGDYLRYPDEMEFSLKIKNKGRLTIDSMMDIPFRILILNRDNEVVETHPPGKVPYWTQSFPVKVGSRDTSKGLPIQEIKKELSNVTARGSYPDKIIKIIIIDSDIKLHDFKYADIVVRFQEEVSP